MHAHTLTIELVSYLSRLVTRAADAIHTQTGKINKQTKFGLCAIALGQDERQF